MPSSMEGPPVARFSTCRLKSQNETTPSAAPDARTALSALNSRQLIVLSVVCLPAINNYMFTKRILELGYLVLVGGYIAEGHHRCPNPKEP